MNSPQSQQYQGLLIVEHALNIYEYTKTLEDKGITSVSGFMLDMYPDYDLMDEGISPDTFYDDYKYFDKYSKYYKFIEKQLFGGMRGRVLGVYDLRLDKVPIIFCSKQTIPIGNHDIYPFKSMRLTPYGCALKHYKFLSTDAEIYKQRAKDNNSGYTSFESQQKYLELLGRNVRDEYSVEYVDSKTLNLFPFLTDYMR